MHRIVSGMGVLVTVLLISAGSLMAADNQPIRIYGSEGMGSWAQGVGEAYMKENPEVPVAVMPGGTMKGIQALLDRNAEIAMASRPILSEEKKAAQDKGINLRELQVGMGGVVFFIHREVSVNALSVDQIKKIFSGAIKNWNEVGGPDMAVCVNSLVYPLHGHGVWLKDGLMKGADFAPETDFRRNGRQLLLHCSSEQGSIGFLGFAEYQARLKSLPNLSVKAVAIRKDDTSPAITAAEATIRDGSYAFTLPYYFYYDDAVAHETVKSFIQYCLDNGDKVGRVAMDPARAE